MQKDIIIAYMTSKYSTLGDLKNFIVNYKRYESGKKHKLIVCFKNLKNEEIKMRKSFLKKVNYKQFIDKETINDFEWGTLKRLCEKYKNKDIFWLNDHSYPIRNNWLKIIFNAYGRDKVIGCSSSFSSHYANSFFRKKNESVIYAIKKIIYYFYLFPNFPNPHLRTTGFLINSSLFLNFIKKKKIKSKLDSFLIESGYNSLTRFLLDNGYKIIIVNSNNKSYDLFNSEKSETFAFKDKNFALISDNQMRNYIVLNKSLKKKKNYKFGEKFKMKKIMRHEQKFLKIFNNEFKNLKKNFSILEFGVSEKALSTSIFLKKCKKKNGKLYSIDVKDYGYHFKSKNWKFLCTRDDNYKYIEKNIPEKFDIIYLDTIHAAHHVKKILYYYFNKLKKDGVFVIDDTSYLPYLRNREKNNFPLEINNLETFEILLEILNVNHKNIHLDFSFIGTGVAKITKLNNSKLKEPKNINSRKFTLQNLLRKIFIYFREKFKNSNLY